VEGKCAKLIVSGITCGLLSATLGAFLMPLLFILPGVMFAVLVAAPWVVMCGRSSGYAWVVAALSMAGYFVAYLITLRSDMQGAPLGAGIGTFIMLAPALFSEHANIRRGACAAIVTGTVAGGVFMGIAYMHEGWWGIMVGIAIWQVAVAAALTLAFDESAASNALPHVKCQYCGTALPSASAVFCPVCRRDLAE
jgi:hypothetical protein